MYIEFNVILFILSMIFLGTFPLWLYFLDEIIDSVEEIFKSIKERMKGE